MKTLVTTPYPSLDQVAAEVGLTAKERAEVEDLIRDQRPTRLRRIEVHSVVRAKGHPKKR